MLKHDRLFAFEATKGAVVDTTLMSLRSFDAVCAAECDRKRENRQVHADDLLLENFEGLDLGGSFLDPEDHRKQIDQSIAHPTHRFLAERVVKFEYQEMLSAAIPKAKVFCLYAEKRIGVTEPALLKHVRQVCELLDTVEKLHRNRPSSAGAHA